MSALHPIAFLLDVDNTLLDNDAAQNDYRDHLKLECGAAAADRYREIFEGLSKQLGYADYLGALQAYRLEDTHDPRLFVMSAFMLDYPFRDRLFPNALDVIRHLRTMGLVVIVSDGDVVFQPRKIERSGLWQAVDGNVLIYVHKEREINDIERRYPASHYIMVDDKLRILTAMKQVWGDRATTVFPHQGHFALDPQALAEYPPADIEIGHIGDLLKYDLAMLSSPRRDHRA
ncbi:MAG: HAD family hydrolase [Terriglobia bacterium]